MRQRAERYPVGGRLGRQLALFTEGCVVDIAAPVKLRMVALMAPIAGYVLMWCVALSWAGSLPDPVAVQWGSAGVTNLNSLVSYYGFFAAGVVVPGGLGLLAAVTANRGTDVCVRAWQLC